MELRGGPWSTDTAEAWLGGARIPVRLAVLTRSGRPLVLSLWFLYEDGALWCATQGDSDVVRHLERDGRCAFEVGPDAPPYRGVRGTGTATIVPDRGPEILERLCDRYLEDHNRDLAEWLLSRGGEVALRVGDLEGTTWDFSGRMEEQTPVVPDP